MTARAPITGEQRQHLREIVNADKRRKLDQARGRDLTILIDTCKGCGTDHDTYADGCRTCDYRRWNRQRRANADYRLKETQRARERRKAA